MGKTDIAGPGDDRVTDQRPFGFLDLACGDASMSAEALRGLRVSQYHGLDISAQALSLAVRNLEYLSCDTSFHRCDFSKRLERWSEPADVVWIGLSLHHFLAHDKAAVMRSIRNRLEPGGLLMIYEDASPDGESRDQWLSRWDEQKPSWTAYSEAEWLYVTDHVHSSDYPETDSMWRDLGRQSGFAHVEQLFESPTRLFRLYSFRA
jgi:SAM-dependent methyltransferase